MPIMGATDAAAPSLQSLQQHVEADLAAVGEFGPGNGCTVGAVDVLVQRLQENTRSMACARAEFALECADLDAFYVDTVGRLRSRHQANEALFRRVSMLEQVFHQERRLHAKARSERGINDPRPPAFDAPELAVGRVAEAQQHTEGLLGLRETGGLEARLRPAKTSRSVLQAYLQRQGINDGCATSAASVDMDTSVSMEAEGHGGADEGYVGNAREAPAPSRGDPERAETHVAPEADVSAAPATRATMRQYFDELA